MVVIFGPGSEKIGREIAGILGVESRSIECRLFTDGESHILIPEEVKGLDVFLVQSTGPPQDKRLVQLLITIDAIRLGKANSITLVAPYIAYARQDRRQMPGEAVSIFTIIRLLLSLGTSKLITVNIHNPAVFKESELEFQDLSAIPLLANYLKGKELGGAFSLSLGKKPVDMEHAIDAASVLGGGFGRLETFRDPSTEDVTLGEADLEVDGRRVIIFDDVITSGRTHLKAVELLRDIGADEVHLACVHSLLKEVWLKKVLDEVDSFVCTDTVPNRFSRVGVAPLIAKALD